MFKTMLAVVCASTLANVYASDPSQEVSTVNNNVTEQVGTVAPGTVTEEPKTDAGNQQKEKTNEQENETVNNSDVNEELAKLLNDLENGSDNEQ
jgi:hypothetical protein